MKLFKHFLILNLALFNVCAAKAEGIIWSQFHANLPINSSWSLFAEFQPRWFNGLKNTQAVLMRGAVLYRINPELRVGLGYGSMPQFIPSLRNESRIFEQLEWTPSISSKLLFLSRTRAEQRWLEGADSVSLRLREKLQISWMNDQFGAYVWNELFWNLNAVSGHVASAYDQNRLSFGPRYQNETITFEVGYILQTIRNVRNVTSSNTGVVSSLGIKI